MFINLLLKTCEEAFGYSPCKIDKLFRTVLLSLLWGYLSVVVVEFKLELFLALFIGCGVCSRGGKDQLSLIQTFYLLMFPFIPLKVINWLGTCQLSTYLLLLIFNQLLS